MKNSALEIISSHCVHICFLVAYLWSTPQSIHLFAHFILFHYIACLKDLKIYQHFDYNHTTAKESIFFLTKPCKTLFFQFFLTEWQLFFHPHTWHQVEWTWSLSMYFELDFCLLISNLNFAGNTGGKIETSKWVFLSDYALIWIGSQAWFRLIS